ncbi:hypothetical protein RMATCC62417_17929 [Rhizopus microsporus]|nr:hypothetical protein RMATCC62417_17929 [Rhizopus microsporus]
MKDAAPHLFENSPIRRMLQHVVQNHALWTVPIVITLFALFTRWSVALNPYSGRLVHSSVGVILKLTLGYNTPPLFGDYEAQRHWMEITLHLPFSQWYTYDLQWWGLDYPPLTAYHSWLCGLIGSKINPDWFALDKSRGIESAESKLFLRSTVVVSEFLLYIPAVMAFCQILYGANNAYLKKYTAACLILMQPALIMIDHGHFQFNNVMLGLTLWAINCFLTQHYVVGSVFFCAALGFKQMALYYAPAVFAFLLGRCFVEERGILLFIKLGITVIATFAILFAPWLRSLEDIQQVIFRVFPVARGLFEDKVANVWCAINVIVKLKQILSLKSTVRLSLFATLIAIIPTAIHLGLKPSRRRFLYALINSSLAFFLFSFQVHEKSILLPLLPATLLVLEEPIATTLFMNTAMFSMFPLLKREGLVFPYFVVTIMWNWIIGEHDTANRGLLEKVCTKGVYGAFFIWHLAETLVEPPSHLPDLYTVINVLLSCGVFCLLFAYFTYRQFTTPFVQKTKTQ